MPSLFLSYSRANRAVAKTLADDLGLLGYSVWMDHELSGGQIWWNQILEKIRLCEVFVFMLDPESLLSNACRIEFGYGADLGKPILPVLVSAGVNAELLPPALSEIHCVDYRKRDADSALLLARSLRLIPPPEVLPTPLPEAPKPPRSLRETATLYVEGLLASAVPFEPAAERAVRTALDSARSTGLLTSDHLALALLDESRSALSEVIDSADAELVRALLRAHLLHAGSSDGDVRVTDSVRATLEEARQRAGEQHQPVDDRLLALALLTKASRLVQSLERDHGFPVMRWVEKLSMTPPEVATP